MDPDVKPLGEYRVRAAIETDEGVRLQAFTIRSEAYPTGLDVMNQVRALGLFFAGEFEVLS